MYIFLLIVSIVAIITYLYYRKEKIFIIKLLNINLLYFIFLGVLLLGALLLYLGERPYNIKTDKSYRYRDTSMSNLEDYRLDNIVEKQMEEENIKYDAGTIKILNYKGIYLKELFIFSYEDKGVEVTRFVEMDRNQRGNLKFAKALDESTILTTSMKEMKKTYNRYFKSYQYKIGYSDGNPVEVYADNLKFTMERPVGYYIEIAIKNRIDFLIIAFILLMIYLANKFIADRRYIYFSLSQLDLNYEIAYSSKKFYIVKAGDSFDFN